MRQLAAVFSVEMAPARGLVDVPSLPTVRGRLPCPPWLRRKLPRRREAVRVLSKSRGPGRDILGKRLPVLELVFGLRMDSHS